MLMPAHSEVPIATRRHRTKAGYNVPVTTQMLESLCTCDDCVKQCPERAKLRDFRNGEIKKIKRRLGVFE